MLKHLRNIRRLSKYSKDAAFRALRSSCSVGQVFPNCLSKAEIEPQKFDLVVNLQLSAPQRELFRLCIARHCRRFIQTIFARRELHLILICFLSRVSALLTPGHALFAAQSKHLLSIRFSALANVLSADTARCFLLSRC